jgi:DNA-binding transcriptional regulator PaaX
MGKLETESKRRTRHGQLKFVILSTIGLAGVLSAGLVAPNVVGAMAKIGLIPSERQREVIKRASNRMVRKGLMKREDGRLRLTAAGERELRSLEMRQHPAGRPRRWDKKWRVLIFDIPERQRTQRNKIRATLQSFGFLRLQGSVWVYPHDCEDLVALLKADLHIGKNLLYMVVDALENDTWLRKEFSLHH